MLNDGTSKDENPEVAICAYFLKATPQVPPSFIKVEELVIDDKLLFDDKRAPKVEL